MTLVRVVWWGSSTSSSVNHRYTANCSNCQQIWDDVSTIFTTLQYFLCFLWFCKYIDSTKHLLKAFFEYIHKNVSWVHLYSRIYCYVIIYIIVAKWPCQIFNSLNDPVVSPALVFVPYKKMEWTLVPKANLHLIVTILKMLSQIVNNFSPDPCDPSTVHSLCLLVAADIFLTN